MLELVEDLASKLKITAISVVKHKDGKKILDININLYSEERLDETLINNIFANHSKEANIFQTGTPFKWHNYLVKDVHQLQDNEEVVYDPKGYIYKMQKSKL